MKAAGRKVKVKLQLLYIWKPLPCLRSLAPTRAIIFKHTEAGDPLCLPSSSTKAPPISGTGLINIAIPVVAPFPMKSAAETVPWSVSQTPLSDQRKARRCLAKANNSRAAYLLGIQSTHVPGARSRAAEPPLGCGRSPQPPPHLAAAAAAQLPRPTA